MGFDFVESPDSNSDTNSSSSSSSSETQTTTSDNGAPADDIVGAVEQFNDDINSELSSDGGCDYELSENVVEDLVEYTRSRTIKNEEQFVLTTLAHLTGFMEMPHTMYRMF